MKTSAFIPNDGYTEPGFIAEVPGLHPALRFTYRPMLVEESSLWLRETEKLKEAAWYRRTAAKMAERLKSWDLADTEGNSLAISGATILRLRAPLFNRLHAILWGNQASDIDPTWTEEQKDEAVEVQAADQAPGASREATNEKNSVPG